ncbi:MAG: N-4 cytosine-specific DNA methylase [Cenarchaeum symbiont of Oopsacas minuta]|nr:N-4 cytosine-specific DNA methylase [Cenarchaeum symbiont of Oopsacas minuta]
MHEIILKKKFVINDIIQKNAKNMDEVIKPNSVALTITSPPYGNAIDYAQHINNSKYKTTKNFRGNEKITCDEYLDDMVDIFSKINEVTISGGFCCIVIADEIINSTLIPLASLLLSRLVTTKHTENGWYLRDMIIWNKITAGRNGSGNRFGQFIKIPVPTRYRSNIMHEYIIILYKGIKARMLPMDTKQKLPLNRALKRQIALSVWDITPVPPKTVKHPAVFPEQIPWRLIQLFTIPGDIVLDPMCGSGQTLKIAKHLKRKYIGIDIKKEYVKLSKKRLHEKPILSNFMIPVYFPIKWSNVEQSGRKIDAHLDVSDAIPTGYKKIFEKTTVDHHADLTTQHIYYKNRAGEYLCCYIGNKMSPYVMKLGNPKKSNSALIKILNKLPKEFELHEILLALPENVPNDPNSVLTIADVLIHSKIIQKHVMTKKCTIYSK